MALKYLVAASAVSMVVIALTADRAVSQQKSGGFWPSLGGLPTLSPYGAPVYGGSAKSMAEAAAAQAVAGAAINAMNKPATTPTTQPVAPPAQPAPTPVSDPAPASGGQTKLRPDQKYAVELSIVNVDAAQRPFIYEDMAKSLAPYDQQKIAALTKGLEANASKEDIATAKQRAAQEGPITATLSNSDFQYNRAQYEPVIRKAWDAQHRYDAFINAKLKAYCPGRDAFARFGSAWRYELIAFMGESKTATDRPDIDVEVMGTAYAPQDGRYTFDFSKVRFTFDEKAIEAAVKEGCAAYSAEGAKFLSKLDPLVARQDWDGAFKLERTSSGPVEPIRQKLMTTLEKLSPNYGYPLMAALQNGKKVKA